MIPRILAACPSLERYRTRSHNTQKELGLPRRQLRVIERTRSRGRALAGRSGHCVYRSNYLIERR